MAHILEAVAEVAEVHWLGLGYRGEVTTQGAVTLHPANVGGGDPFGAVGGRDLVDEVGADTVLLYNDLWFLEKYKRLFATPRDVRVIAYCPLDGRIVDPVLGDMVSWVDDVVVFSDFARREFEHIGVGPVHVIGHGVDDVAFRPVPRADARAMLPAGWDDAFVVLNANRLQPRVSASTSPSTPSPSSPPPGRGRGCSCTTRSRGWATECCSTSSWPHWTWAIGCT